MAREILTTERLALREAGPEDAQTVQNRLASDWDVVRCTGSWVWPPDLAFTTGRCLPIPREMGVGGVITREGEIIGMMTILGKGEFGYMLARSHWGQGFATEMGHAVVAEAIARQQWGQLVACVFDDNPGSARVLQKLGFTKSAACTGYCASRGIELPTQNFTLDVPRA